MHLLSTRFAIDSNLWLDSCALIVAVSSRSVEMVKLLLDSCYGSSPPGGQVRSEVNRALLETVYEYGEEANHQDDSTHRIIQLLITEGGANPHLPSMIQFPGYMRSSSEYDGEIQEETPLTAAVRAADPVAVQCMMNAYSTSLQEAKQERRRDPMLAQQPESYFRVLEEREYDIIHSSVDAALVASLFLLRYTGNLDYGKCSLVLYEHRTLPQQGLQWLEKCILSGRLIPTIPQGSCSSESDDSFEVALIRYHNPNCRGKKKSKSINDTCLSDSHMDWSYVLATLPWFKSRMNGVNCNWLKRVMLDPKLQEVDYQGAVEDDEFDLVVEGGVKLCAHRSIVSAKCGKLAAQIRFTESLSNSDGGRLTVHVDLPQLVAKMLLSHIYHGTIVFCEALAVLLRDPFCVLKSLSLSRNNNSYAGVIAIANSLNGNFNLELEKLHLTVDDLDQLRAVDTFSNLLCNTSSIDSIHSSNHTLETLTFKFFEQPPQQLVPLLIINKCTNKHHVLQLTGLQVWALARAQFPIGQLLATVPQQGINLRSKVAVFWKALLMLRYLSHPPVSESHLKNESKWHLCTSSPSIYCHLVDHAAHGDLAPKRAENLKFSSPVGERPRWIAQLVASCYHYT